MTDNEIIKALECCNGDLYCCKECPAKENNVECGDVLKFNVLKLISRQKSEINRLKNELHGKVDYIHEQQEVINDLKDKYNKKGLTVEVKFDKEQLEETVQGCMRDYEFQINEIRNGAIKEFAENLKQQAFECDVSFGFGKEHYTEAVAVFDIEKLVEEMTEGENG